MKYLIESSIIVLNEELKHPEVVGNINFVLEAFSCKMIKQDKKEWRNMEDKKTYLPLLMPLCTSTTSPIDLTSMSTGFTLHFHSIDINNLNDSYKIRTPNPAVQSHKVNGQVKYFISPKVFCHLRSTLKILKSNLDVDSVESTHFSYEPNLHGVISLVDSLVFGSGPSNFALECRNKLWSKWNEIAEYEKCYIFRYIPPMEDDGEVLFSWALYFLFYNESKKRIYYMSIINSSEQTDFGSLSSLNKYYYDDDLEG